MQSKETAGLGGKYLPAVALLCENREPQSQGSLILWLSQQVTRSIQKILTDKKRKKEKKKRKKKINQKKTHSSQAPFSTKKPKDAHGNKQEQVFINIFVIPYIMQLHIFGENKSYKHFINRG